MTISVPELISLGTYFVLMMAIGLYAYKTSTSDVSEYMLGGRNLHPAVGALSAGASDMSGWMLMGLPGAIYVSGFSAAWIAVGLVIGAYLNYRFVAPRLRIYTEMADDSITIPDFFEKRFHDSSHALRTISALVIIVFFTVYTSSGIVAGGKLFESAFGLNYQLGLFVTAGVVLAYTVVGGFLAVSLTDFVQGCIMFIALILVPVIAYFVIGGWSGMESAITSAPSYVDADSGAVGPARSQFFDMWPESMTVVGLVSLLAWGLGYFGQPHIIVRFMAIRSLKDIKTARIIGMSWMLVTVIGAVFVGAVGVAYVQQHDLGAQLTDSEAIFILLSQIIFHPLVAGFLLAAILASSSSITEDVYKTFFRREASQSELVMIGRIATVVVSLVAIALAFDPNSNILDLVSNAWAGFGSAFGPIILLSLFWRHLTRDGALAGMIVGAVTVLVWLYVPLLPAEGGAVPLETLVYAMIPGFLLSGLAAYLVSVIGRSVKPKVAAGFDDMSEVMNDAP